MDDVKTDGVEPVLTQDELENTPVSIEELLVKAPEPAEEPAAPEAAEPAPELPPQELPEAQSESLVVEAPAPVEEPAAAAPAVDAPWGFVDSHGAIRLRDGKHFKGKVLGRAPAGADPQEALRPFVERFADIEANAVKVEKTIRDSRNKVSFLERLSNLRQWLTTGPAVGDFDRLIEAIDALVKEIKQETDDNLLKKEALCRAAQELLDEPDARDSRARMQTLMNEWQNTESAGKSADDALWARFSDIRERFFNMSRELSKKRSRENEEGRTGKEELCRLAEELAGSSDWKTTAEALGRLMERWKQVPSAGRAQDQALWTRFRAAQNEFFRRRQEHFQTMEKSQQENLRRKEALCVEAEALVLELDTRAAREKVKNLQNQWKDTGPVPVAKNRQLWDRFRAACNRVFETTGQEDRARRDRWRTALKEAVIRKTDQVLWLKDSLEHDQEVIKRLEANLADVPEGDRAEERKAGFQKKIDVVAERVQSKIARIAELEDAIHEIQTKLDPQPKAARNGTAAEVPVLEDVAASPVVPEPAAEPALAEAPEPVVAEAVSEETSAEPAAAEPQPEPVAVPAIEDAPVPQEDPVS